MRRLGAPLLLLSSLTWGGCGYIHFGRLPPERSGDAALLRAYSDLTLEHKVLKQELLLARKETDTLRSALERAAGTAPTGRSNAEQQLEATTRELAQLRARLAELQAQRNVAATATDDGPRPPALQEEVARMQRTLEDLRRENAGLAAQLKTSLAAQEEAQTMVGQLNTELLAQKQARERAEQTTLALRAQLDAVMARVGRADAIPPAAAPTPSAPAPSPAPVASLSALQSAKAPPSDAAATAELRTSQARLRPPAPAPVIDLTPPPTTVPAATALMDPAPGAASSRPAAEARAPRKYTVQSGDTLEKIAARFYGKADQWVRIYSANSDLLTSGQGLKPGLELQIPE